MKKQTQLIKITAEILAAALFLSGCASKPAAAPETAPHIRRGDQCPGDRPGCRDQSTENHGGNKSRRNQSAGNEAGDRPGRI